MPERVEFLNYTCVRDKEVAAIGEHGKDGAKNSLPVAPGGEVFARCTKLSDCSERGLGKCQLSSEVGRGLDRRGEPEAEPPYSLGWGKEHGVNHYRGKGNI